MPAAGCRGDNGSNSNSSPCRPRGSAGSGTRDRGPARASGYAGHVPPLTSRPILRLQIANPPGHQRAVPGPRLASQRWSRSTGGDPRPGAGAPPERSPACPRRACARASAHYVVVPPGRCPVARRFRRSPLDAWRSTGGLLLEFRRVGGVALFVVRRLAEHPGGASRRRRPRALPAPALGGCLRRRRSAARRGRLAP